MVNSLTPNNGLDIMLHFIGLTMYEGVCFLGNLLENIKRSIHALIKARIPFKVYL